MSHISFRHNLSTYQIFLKTKDETSNISVSKSISYTSEILENIVPIKFYQTKVDVVNDDTLNVATRFECPIVLNMANPKIPGLNNRGMTQEEILLKRTNLIHCLTSDLYPIPSDGGLFSPEVYIVKDENFISIPHKKISVLSTCAINRPNFNRKKDHILTVKIIENIFKICIMQKKKDLILGALGCGMFQNDPKIIAEIFKFCLQKYDGCFDNIIFAVLSKKDNNYTIFKNILMK